MSKVRTVRLKEKKDIMHMWDVVFHEGSAYMELYFRRKFRPELCMAAEEDGILVSSLEILPYPFIFHRTLGSSGYLSGVATLPEWRGRGLMGEVLAETFRYQRQLGQLVSTLIPASASLYELYARYGFVTAFHLHREMVHRETDAKVWPLVKWEGKLEEQIYDYYDQQQQKYVIASLKTVDDLDVVALEHWAGGGEIWTMQQEGKICGMAFAIWQGQELLLKEVWADDKEQKRELVQSLMQHYGVKQCWVTTAARADGEPLGMARIVHVQRALTLYAMAHPYQRAILQVHDPFVVENCGVYVLQGGECQVTFTQGQGMPVDIAQLTKFLLLGGQLDGLSHPQIEPYMNLMLN